VVRIRKKVSAFYVRGFGQGPGERRGFVRSFLLSHQRCTTRPVAPPSARARLDNRLLNKIASSPPTLMAHEREERESVSLVTRAEVSASQ
jgi:hypothetical protein